jgi:hypothetical protein
MSVDSSSPASRPLPHRIARWVTKAVMAICALLAILVIAGQFIGQQDLQERPLHVGEAVSVKNASKGWRPGFVRSISAQGHYEIAMGATREIAARPQTDIIQVEGTGRLKRRKEDTP